MSCKYTVRAWDAAINNYVTLDSGVDHRRALDVLAMHLPLHRWTAGVFSVTRDAPWTPEETVDLSAPAAAETQKNDGWRPWSGLTESERLDIVSRGTEPCFFGMSSILWMKDSDGWVCKQR